MFFVVIGIIALISVLLALVALQRQLKLDEINHAKKKLKQKRVIYQRDS